MELGRLERVEVREVWENEARDFTPWLLDHDDHLAEALGIDLEIQRSEHPVGNFSLDLIGRDLTNDAVLIVENQLGGTDHNHLGQILTYTAGARCSTAPGSVSHRTADVVNRAARATLPIRSLRPSDDLSMRLYVGV